MQPELDVGKEHCHDSKSRFYHAKSLKRAIQRHIFATFMHVALEVSHGQQHKFTNANQCNYGADSQRGGVGWAREHVQGRGRNYNTGYIGG